MMTSQKRPGIRFYTMLALVGLVILGLWPSLVTAMPLTARQHLERAWQFAADVGRFEYDTSVIQTTHPTTRLENAGRHPTTRRLTAEGMVDRPNKSMQMHFWAQGQNRHGIDLKVENGVAYGRLNAEEDWLEIPNPTDIFAPGGDPLGFLVAAENVQQLTNGQLSIDDSFESVIQNPKPVVSKVEPSKIQNRYAFDVNSVRYAEYVRWQLEGTMRQRGELPPQIQLGVIKQYVNMKGRGEIWLDENGLPVHQIIHLEFPPEPGDFNWSEAEITTDFSGWEQGLEARGSGVMLLARRLWENPGQFFTVPGSFIHNSQFQQFGLILGLSLLFAALAILPIIYHKSRKFYAAVTLAMITAMLVTPLLQSNQVHAFFARQQAKQTEIEQQQAAYEATQDVQTGISNVRSTYNPTINPLADTTTNPNTHQLPIQNSSFTIHNSPFTIPNASAYTCENGLTSDDCDGDGLTNEAEIYKLGTDPDNADSDGDDISDKTEIEGFTFGGNTWYLDPLNPDSSSTFPADAIVYTYVDSINYDTTSGNVLESNENNNLFGPTLSTAGVDSAVVPAGPSGLPAGLPERTHRR